MNSMEDIASLPVAALKRRGVDEATAKLYGVRVEYDENGEEACYYFPLYRDGSLVGYQAKKSALPGGRKRGDVWRVGDTKGGCPFSPPRTFYGGFCVVTEGAEDALSASQMLRSLGKNYLVVASLGTDSWKRQLEWFSSFKAVAIAFDQDEAGRLAAQEFAAALKPGQAKIVTWGGKKDPNALLSLDDGAKVFYDAILKAKPYSPAGIIWGEEVWRRMESYVKPESIPYPDEWAALQAKTDGMRAGEISLWTAGTSVGKTSYIRRLKQHVLTNTEWNVGEVELEEVAEKTWRGLMQFYAGKRWHEMTMEERREAYEATYGSGRIFTLDHRSQYARGQSLVGKFKHLHYALDCRIIFLDHITLAVNEFGDGSGNTAQDQMMGEFLEFVETTGCHLCLISHLRKSGVGGKSFEEGAIPTEDDLKGSGSLKQISFDIIGVSRNKMHPDEYERNVSQLHIMKCRETGSTGPADRLHWDGDAQTLEPAREYEGEGEENDTRF